MCQLLASAASGQYITWFDKSLSRCVISYREKKATLHKTVCWDYAADQFFIEEDVASHALPVTNHRRRRRRRRHCCCFLSDFACSRILFHRLCFARLKLVCEPAATRRGRRRWLARLVRIVYTFLLSRIHGSRCWLQLRDFEKTFASERAKFIESQQKPKSSGSKLKKKKSKDGDVDKPSDSAAAATSATTATNSDAKKA